MVKDNYFHYRDIVDICGANVFCVEIANIYSESELYNVYDMHLKFPYFGFNWDPLRDSLCGLDEWMKEKEIVVIHRELPHFPEKDLGIYVTVLYDVCELWEKYPDALNFQVFFPEKNKTTISKILENINSRFEVNSPDAGR